MFYDREDAAQQLAEKLDRYKNKPNAIVLAMPRGGVVIGQKIAQFLKLPLDIIIARKISAPGNPEYAIGAVAESGDPILNEEIIGTMGITPDYLDNEIIKQREEIKHRLALYRQNQPALELKNKIVIVADDGIATGFTLQTSLEHIKSKKPAKIIVAVPVAPSDSILKIKKIANEVVCLEIPDDFFAIGQFYDHFDQVSDEEVIKLLS